MRVHSVYVVGSALAGPYVHGVSDLDLTVFLPPGSDLFRPILAHGEGASILIYPHPSDTGGLLPTILIAEPSAVSTLMFLSQPRKLLLGEPIEDALPPPDDLADLVKTEREEVELWSEEKLFAAGIRVRAGQWRAAAKALGHAAWGLAVPGHWPLPGRVEEALRVLEEEGAVGEGCADEYLACLYGPCTPGLVAEVAELCVEPLLPCGPARLRRWLLRQSF